LRAMAVEDGFQLLQRIMQLGAPQIIAVLADWSRYVAQLPGERAPDLLRELVGKGRVTPAAPAGAASSVDFATELASLPATQRLPRIVAFVETHAARALGLPPGKSVDPQRPLHDLGLDSLQSVELRNALAASLRVPLSATLLFDYPTVESLARYLAKDVLRCELNIEKSSSPVGSGHQAIDSVRSLSDEDAEAALLRELDRPTR
jgi:acyl carrier protein